MQAVVNKSDDMPFLHSQFLALSHSITNLLFPPRCVSCSVPVDEAHALCTSCFTQLRFVSSPMCSLCGYPFEYDLGEGALCGGCIYDPPAYDEGRTVWHYDDVSRHMITWFKYSDQTDRLPTYARLLGNAGADVLASADVIVPVPLHRKRMLGRKYNQSALLAHGLSDYSGVPVIADGLQRIKHTPPQAGLSRAERLSNVRGAFLVNPTHANALAGKSVVLIDDVMTTGATIDACTRALKKAKVAWVGVLTLARSFRAD